METSGRARLVDERSEARMLLVMIGQVPVQLVKMKS
jgi:hypothetical protein